MFGVRGHSSVLSNAEGVGGVKFPGKKHYPCVQFNVISVTRGWAISRKNSYVTLEWLLDGLLLVLPAVHRELFH